MRGAPDAPRGDRGHAPLEEDRAARCLLCNPACVPARPRRLRHGPARPAQPAVAPAEAGGNRRREHCGDRGRARRLSRGDGGSVGRVLRIGPALPALAVIALQWDAAVFEIGNSLREARLRQGLDFPEIEQGTKIRAKYLRALEDEQFEVLPAQTYVKGFLRSYAEYLGLDGQLYVDEYNSRFVVGEEESPARPRRSAPPSRGVGVQVQSRVVLLTLLGIAAVTALVIVAWTRGEPEQAVPVGLGGTHM